MSNYKGHFFFNLIIFIPFVFFINKYFFVELHISQKIINYVLLLSISILFTLWPDIDTKSVGQRYFYIVFFIADIILIITDKLNEAALLGLMAMLPIISNHRGFFHSLFAVFFFPAVFLLAPGLYHQSFTYSKIIVGLPYYLAGVLGYLGHYILDGLLWKNIKRKIL
ncbi:MAG TPA: metal-dependent hydrolase [Ignavibacteriales bacterium]|nr:metal-dependent hydrolase [Ignavibacteriales bacterium]HOM65881.1 metal-dependent hydrolase [Ignavibacteriales bacterium]HPD67637.1 metal-dependent hydrolase [Ignavibacteriales bacterium]HPP33290.1 metal-dependent hydrolase [Ignavibacteriales bacterium]HRR17966.1 metal-dependent hydrolase [Ignavibacteriales bacterium]